MIVPCSTTALGLVVMKLQNLYIVDVEFQILLAKSWNKSPWQGGNQGKWRVNERVKVCIGKRQQNPKSITLE